MRIISKKIFKDFYEQSKHKEVLKLNWSNPNEIKEMCRSASIIGAHKQYDKINIEVK